jgi:arylsulfatase A
MSHSNDRANSLPGKLLRAITTSILTAVIALLAITTSSAYSAEKRSVPNVVLFLVDDMGWIDPACYGNRFHETPHIDRLAAQGMRFTNAYAACPVCSPTRASILTGKYPATLGLTDFIPGHWRPWEKLVVPEIHLQLPLEEITFAELLHPAGYVSASFGKWHLGGPAFFPGQQGFDEFLVTSGRHFAPRFNTTPRLPVEDGTYLADFLTARAEQFLERHQETPFVLYLPHYAVHIPLEAEEELIEKYRHKSKVENHLCNPVYAAMVEHIDRSLGRIMTKLEELELAENTVLIFFSDNGGLYTSVSRQGEPVMVNTPLRDEKGSLYEGGIRVPLIVRWPGEIEAGSECHVPVTSVDFFPTMAELAGVPVTHSIDGESLVPLLRQSGDFARDAIYWHYPHYHHSTPAGAIRSGDWKLIEFFDDGRLELYHLRDDLGETTNLAETPDEKAKQFRDKLAAWRTSVDARMPTKNPDYDPARAHEWKRRTRP